MTVEELQKYLLRFPTTAVVEVKAAQGTLAIDSVQMVFDTSPIQLGPENLTWADQVKDKVKAQLVTALPRPAVLPTSSKEP